MLLGFLLLTAVGVAVLVLLGANPFVAAKPPAPTVEAIEALLEEQGPVVWIGRVPSLKSEEKGQLYRVRVRTRSGFTPTYLVEVATSGLARVVG